MKLFTIWLASCELALIDIFRLSRLEASFSFKFIALESSLVLISSKRVGIAFFSAPIAHLLSFSILEALFEAAIVFVVPLVEMASTMRLIVAELAFILLIGRVIFIAAFAVPAVVLPFANVALE